MFFAFLSQLDLLPTPQRDEMDALLPSVAQMVEDRRFGEVADVLDNAELEVRGQGRRQAPAIAAMPANSLGQTPF
jgi:hypothetical protein